MNKNTVLILGAGFSKVGGLPLQRELLPEILVFDGGGFHFDNAQDVIKTFISENFPGVDAKDLTLEDLFTILDKAVLGKEYFCGYRWQELYSIRKSLVYSLMVLIDKKMENNRKIRGVYDDFARFICQGGSPAGGHNIGIISLNWDTLIESVINDLDGQSTDRPELDYCLYNSTLSPFVSDPPFAFKPDRTNSTKIMKLHGSINWLYCPNCGRLYIDLIKNIGIDYKTPCPSCTINEERKIILEEMIVTPTMLKEFQNHHLRLAWQHAFAELNRADTAIFIGYSLPLADFELRYFFKKAFSKKSNLVVVLHAGDKSNGTKERYESFFGAKNIQFCFDGFEEWWDTFRAGNGISKR